ncbi:TIGR01777 family oxidoreductase [Gordonia polyisoprenivorans]|uniref:TIGR01777 family oxidoreductase n=1 Tax=Gordonia polyisoprenivorans TaxID=84595 RepID=UPI00230189A3|nr:TIGR01777 family oxidoreductase [Gordonia polyisoprenivorans]WCB35512.1 TIGR01777 family oxidoreductase [Gordonia polyisoprenivorans]
MRVAVAGSSGLIGSALITALESAGHSVRRLVRREATEPGEFSWDPETFGVPDEALDGIDAVVSLGGVGVGNGRWSGRFKQELRDSRIPPTEVIAEAVRRTGVPTLVSASATGYYGDTGARTATEVDGPGSGFLAELTVDWEAAATANSGDRTRVVLLRTAPVLAPHGGLLAKLRPLFKLGLGGTIGNGQQYFSWISLADEIRAIEFALDSAISGPVNLCAPGAVPFATFVDAFGRSVHRPTLMGVPSFVARKAGGEMIEEMVLYSQRVAPGVLTDHDFVFTHPTIDSGLEYANGR